MGIGAVETVASGVGIDGMRARLSSLDGKLILDSPSGRGTRVRAMVRANAATATAATQEYKTGGVRIAKQVNAACLTARWGEFT